MTRIVLTDRGVVAAKAAEGERLELWDEKVSGLHLRVTDRGVKTWVVRYRASDGRQPRLVIGKFPSFGLKDAREKAGDILKEVAKGADPATERRQARAVPKLAIKTFNDLADQYLAVCESGEWKPKGKKKKASVLKEEIRILSKNVRPTLGKLVFGTITRAEVKSLLKKMYARGVMAQTNRTQAVIRQVYSYAISEDWAEVNPATGFAPLAQQKPRARIWKDEELKALWSALSDPSNLVDEDGEVVRVSEHLCIALKLAALLGQRRAEIIGMEIEELDFTARTWTIRAERMKGSQAHLVPLPAPAIDLIQKAIAIANEGRNSQSAFVFRTSWTDERAIRPNSLGHALRRINLALQIKGATLHDLRRTMSTNLTSERCGVSQFVRSKILGHIDAGGGAMVSATHYDLNSYIVEKRQGLDRWAELLLEIVGEQSDPSVSGAPDAARRSSGRADGFDHQPTLF